MVETTCDLTWLADTRKSNIPQIWVAGCSFALGFGVNNEQRYGQIVAESLRMEVSFLSILGSSIPWAADQILRSDIRKDDIVLWGLTNISRYVTFKNAIFVNVLPETFTMDVDPIKLATYSNETRQHVLDYYKNYQRGIDEWSTKDQKQMQSDLLHEDRLMQAVQSVHQVNNFCNKVGAKFIVFVHHLNLPEYQQFVIDRISSLDSYLDARDEIDKGTNGTHPGPLSHKRWAEDILKVLNK